MKIEKGQQLLSDCFVLLLLRWMSSETWLFFKNWEEHATKTLYFTRSSRFFFISLLLRILFYLYYDYDCILSMRTFIPTCVVFVLLTHKTGNSHSVVISFVLIICFNIRVNRIKIIKLKGKIIICVNAFVHRFFIILKFLNELWAIKCIVFYMNITRVKNQNTVKNWRMNTDDVLAFESDNRSIYCCIKV